MRREIVQPLDVELLTGRWEERSAGSNADRTAVTDLLEQPLNDYGNGQRLIVAHGGCLRYCPAFKTWLVGMGVWLDSGVDIPTPKACATPWGNGRENEGSCSGNGQRKAAEAESATTL